MIHINKFIDRIRANESRSQRDFIMSMSEAKELHGDITKLLLALHTLQEASNKPAKETKLEVEVDGGTF